MAKAGIKVIPMVNIEYAGKKYRKGCNPFDMDNETAQSLIDKGLVKQAGMIKENKGVDNG